MSGRHDVSHVLQVSTLFHQLDELGFVDDFLAGCVHQQTTLRHATYEGMVDGVLRLSRSRNVQRNDVASRIKLFSASNRLHTIGLDHFFRTESIVSIDVHTEALGDACHVTTYVAIGMNT